jgi:hypothetical protein
MIYDEKVKKSQIILLVFVMIFSIFNFNNLYSAKAIYNGESAVSDPLVSATYNNQGCSNAVIAPRILAMAQHCPATIGATRFTYPGDNFVSKNTGMTGKILAKFVPSGNFLPGREYDIVLVVIDQEFPVSNKLKIATESDIARWKSNKTEIVTYGFGETGTATKTETSNKGRFYISPSPDYTSGISPSYSSVLSLNPKNNTSEVCNGDSGGPSYVFENEDIYYIGVTISINRMNGCGVDQTLPFVRVQALYAFMDLLDQANDWIEKNPLKSISQKNKTIVCKKGKVSKKISAARPKCPKGFKVSK